MRDRDGDVLIVGLGPTGAVLAGLLGAHGVRVIVVERDLDIYPLPRAAHFDHEIMRVYQQLGVGEAVLEHARPAPAYEFRAADGTVLLRMDASSRPSPSGWATGYMFHQPGVERAVRTKLAHLPTVEIRLGARLEALRQDLEGVEALTVGPGGETRITARFAVGCDGASSRVRETLDVALEDFQFDEPWLVVDVRVLEPDRLPNVNLQLCDPARPTTCVLMGPGRHRWEFMLLDGETADQVLDDAFIQARLARWDCADAVVIERKAVYRFHGLLAERWRDGRILLAGDAAHQMPPFAGQGMCSGVRDAANLAWKLAAVVRGEADAALLDTYGPERAPHVRDYINLAIGMGRVVCALDPAVVAARDAAMTTRREAGAAPLTPAAPAPFGAGAAVMPSPGAGVLFPQPWGEDGGSMVRLDDVLGQGAWLIADLGCHAGRDVARVSGVKAWDLADVALDPFRAALRAWLDQHEAKGVLVRPDRYVFATGDPAVLMKAYADRLRPRTARARPTRDEGAVTRGGGGA